MKSERIRHPRLVSVLLLLLLAAAPVLLTAKATFPLVYDDGEADTGYSAETGLFDVAMRFDLPQVPLQLEEVSFCLRRTGADTDLEFDVLLFAADGPGGSPGTLLDLAPLAATDVGEETFLTYDLSAREWLVEVPVVYLAIGWQTEVDVGFAACGDHDGLGGPPQPGFRRIVGEPWTSLSASDPAYRALMLRAVFSGGETATCVPDATALCLAEDRFRVEAHWQTNQGTSGAGQAVELTADTGYFWFFNPANVEMVVKVLDGCGINGRFWVFAGGLTDVDVEFRVTDTLAGTMQIYRNPQGTAFVPIQDVRAFETCP